MSDDHGGGGGGKKRRAHEEEHEEHENHERWLVSYADMMTLLMVLFIVMFAISQVDSKKFMALKTGLTAGFGAPIAMLEGADAMLSVGGEVAPDRPNLSGAASGGSGKGKDQQPQSVVDPQKVAELAKATSKAQVAKEVENLQQAQGKIEEALKKAGMRNNASFRFDERGLVITIATDSVLFENGSAVLADKGRGILNAIAPTLTKLPNRISIDGHTNSIPINTSEFPSNWELSADRATGVLRYLMATHQMPAKRLSASGFADTHPLVPASNPRALTVNRRVEIVILARVDNSAGRAIEELGNAPKPTESPSAPAEPAPSESPTAAPTAKPTPGATSGPGATAKPAPKPTGLRTVMPTMPQSTLPPLSPLGG